jgi:hypothetical protein
MLLASSQRCRRSARRRSTRERFELVVEEVPVPTATVEVTTEAGTLYRSV